MAPGRYLWRFSRKDDFTTMDRHSVTHWAKTILACHDMDDFLDPTGPRAQDVENLQESCIHDLACAITLFKPLEKLPRYTIAKSEIMLWIHLYRQRVKRDKIEAQRLKRREERTNANTSGSHLESASESATSTPNLFGIRRFKMQDIPVTVNSKISVPAGPVHDTAAPKTNGSR